MPEEPADDPGTATSGDDRLARLRSGLAAEQELLTSLSVVIAGLRAAARATEEALDLEAGWQRVERALPDEPST